MKLFAKKNLAFELVPSSDPRIRSIDSIIAKL